MDNELLAWALERARAQLAARNGYAGVGTLGERTLHAALKYALEPDEAFHEVKLDGFVADIARPSGIIEVQTGSFYPLARKVQAFLDRGPVTVVHPLAVKKRLIWVDPLTGESTPPRRVGRAQRLADAAAQLYWLRDLLPQPGLTVKLVLLEMDEYRLKNGRGPEGKIGASRTERIPTAYLGEVVITGPQDIPALLPQLPEIFTVPQLDRATGLRGRNAYNLRALLAQHGLIARTGDKKGNAYLWRRNY